MGQIIATNPPVGHPKPPCPSHTRYSLDHSMALNRLTYSKAERGIWTICLPIGGLGKGIPPENALNSDTQDPPGFTDELTPEGLGSMVMIV